MGDKTVDNVYCDFTKPITDGGECTIIALFDLFNKFKNFVDQVFKKWLAISTWKHRPFIFTPRNQNSTRILTPLLHLKYWDWTLETQWAHRDYLSPLNPANIFSLIQVLVRAVGSVELQLKTDTADRTKVGHAYGGTGHQTFSLQATLELAKGNQIRLMLLEGQMPDNESHYTNFVGHLLTEDIV